MNKEEQIKQVVNVMTNISYVLDMRTKYLSYSADNGFSLQDTQTLVKIKHDLCSYIEKLEELEKLI